MTNKTSISLAFSAAAILMLLASSLPLSSLLQPVQAQTTMTFRATEPADGRDGCMGGDATLAFDAQGTPSASNPQRLDITSGTFTVNC